VPRISSKTAAPEPVSAGETIGDWTYYHDAQGDLYRMRNKSLVATPVLELVVPKVAAEFALRSARLAAGLPEHGSGR